MTWLLVKLFIAFVVAWVLGVIGWAQIIGGLRTRPVLVFPVLFWTVVMSVAAYFAIAELDCMWSVIIGYGISFLQVFSQDKID